jgi:hypothetical protein
MPIANPDTQYKNTSSGTQSNIHHENKGTVKHEHEKCKNPTFKISL